MPGDRAEHVLNLASELLEDVELQRTPIQAAVLKATRLARLVDDDEAQAWLSMELYGLKADDLGREHMTLTGRWTDQDEGKGYWQGVTELEALIEAYTQQLASMRLPDLSGEYIAIALRETRRDQSSLSRAIATFGAVRAKVWALLHTFASTRYYELVFSRQQSQLFEEARSRIDSLLSPLSGEVLSKVESIYRRLGEGDAEAVSQALNTCRRLIDAVANAVLAPTDEPRDIGGGAVLQLGPSHVQNRLNVYVRDRTQSTSRRDKMRHTLSDLYDRASAGVHDDVSFDEARFLFLNTYLYLGEVLALDGET